MRYRYSPSKAGRVSQVISGLWPSNFWVDSDYLKKGAINDEQTKTSTGDHDLGSIINNIYAETIISVK